MHPTLRSLSALLLAVLITAITAACATGGPDRNKLDRTLYAYAGAIRWGDIDGAAAFVDPKVREQRPLTDLERQRFEQVQVTGYYVRGSEQPRDEELRQVVEIRLVNRHTLVERSVTDRQHWRWDSDAKRWWLVSGLPDISVR